MPDTPYLDKVLALTRDYTRVERGRSEHVRGHISRSSVVKDGMSKPANISDALKKHYQDAAAAHPHEVERRKIMDRLFAAEFGNHLLMDPPDTPPEQWEQVLGEHVDPAILARAQEHAALPKGSRMPGQRLFKSLFADSDMEHERQKLHQRLERGRSLDRISTPEGRERERWGPMGPPRER